MISTQREPRLFILLCLASFASVSAVLYTPALPDLAQYFGVSNAQAQSSMTAFLLGYAFGNLPYGPLANRYGRKPVLCAGILLACIASILILLAGTFHWFSLLVLGRFLSALGSCVGLKMTFTMIADVYSQAKATKAISYIMLSFAIAPGLAITLGGVLTDYFGWKSCFYFLLLYSLGIYGLTSQLKETALQLDGDALNIRKIGLGFVQQLKNGRFILCAVMMGCASGFIYLFAGEAPFIAIEKIGLKADVYGILNCVPPIGMIIGSLLAHRWAETKTGPSVILLGSLLAFGCSVLMFTFFVLGIVNVWSLFIPMPFLYIGLSFVFSNASGLAMSHATNKSNASAVMNFINMGVSVALLFTISSFSQSGAYILPSFFVVLSIMILILLRAFCVVERAHPKYHQ